MSQVHRLYTETEYFTCIISLTCPATTLCPGRYDKMSDTFCDLCPVSKTIFLIVVEIGQHQIKAPKGLMTASKLSLLPVWHPECCFFWGGEVGSEGQYCVFTRQKIPVLVTLEVANKYLKKVNFREKRFIRGTWFEGDTFHHGGEVMASVV